MVTVILPISRKEYMLPMFKCLEELEKPKDTELLLVVDGDRELHEMVESLLDVLTGKYRRIQVRDFGDSPAAALDDRRYRIANIHNFTKQFLSEDNKYVFLVEDDTNFPKDALTKMIEEIKKPYVAFVEGVEVGRWKTPYIGGWLVDDVDNPTLITSVDPSKGIQQIDAGGLYCCLVDANLYFEHIFEPLDKQGKNGLSCDINFGIWLKRKGFRCIIDWSIDCGHYKDGRQLHLKDVKPVKAIFEKDLNGKWLGRGEWSDDKS